MRELTEDEVRTLAKIFARKASRFGQAVSEDAAMQIIVDTELTVSGGVPYEDWVASAKEEGWL